MQVNRRFTGRDEDGVAYIKHRYSDEDGMWSCEHIYAQDLDNDEAERFAELEEKIEAGTLVEKKTGQWEAVDECVWRCTNCGELWYMSNPDSPIENEMLFCPKCNASMTAAANTSDSREEEDNL